MEKKGKFVLLETTHKASGKKAISSTILKGDDKEKLPLGCEGRYFENALKKYKEDAFEVKIVKEFESMEEMLNEETRLITSDVIKSNMYYNLYPVLIEEVEIAPEENLK